MKSDRRKFIAAMGGTALAAPIAMARAPKSELLPQRTFVLVHGAWHGGWCFKEVAKLMRRSGQDVYAPTLTGLGERSHLGVNLVNLELHVQDIVRVIEFEELRNIVLVGHSYGGMVVTGVADRLAERVSTIVYLDAFVPENDGDSVRSLVGPSVGNATGAMGLDGWSVAPPSAESLGVRPSNRDRVERLSTRQPLATMLQGLKLTGRHKNITDRHFVFATGWGGADSSTPFRPFYEKLRHDPSWKTHVVPFGHDMMIDEPEAVTRLLMAM